MFAALVATHHRTASVIDLLLLCRKWMITSKKQESEIEKIKTESVNGKLKVSWAGFPNVECRLLWKILKYLFFALVSRCRGRERKRETVMTIWSC